MIGHIHDDFELFFFKHFHIIIQAFKNFSRMRYFAFYFSYIAVPSVCRRLIQIIEHEVVGRGGYGEVRLALRCFLSSRLLLNHS